MPISVRHDIGPILDRRLPALVTDMPDHAPEIVNLVREFHDAFDAHVLAELQEGSFCKVIDAWLESRNLDPVLQEIIRKQRQAIFAEMIHAKRRDFVLPSNADLSRPGNNGERRRNGTSPQKRTPEQISDVVTQYAQLAVYLGDTVALDILQMLGILKPGERASALSSISRYLGECAPPENGSDDVLVNVLQSDEAILQNMTVYEKMEWSLNEFCYQHLIHEEADTLENQPWFLENIEEWVREKLDGLYGKAFGQKSAKISVTHQDLYSGVVDHFKAAAALELPDAMSKTATDHNGKEWPLGSWRQRLALADVMNPRKRHMCIGFGAGEGKTFTHNWGFELAKKERNRLKLPGRPRMLFIGPKAVLNEIPNRVRKGSAPKETDSLYYPDPALAPTVGVIRAGMSLMEICEAASADIVYCAYSMWNMVRKVKKEGGSDEQIAIADLLINQEEPFTSFSVDESHLLQGGKVYTHLARRTIQEIPGLYDKGHIIFSSATPAPGHLAGARITLELLEPPRNGIQQGERQDAPPNHWAELRRMLPRRLWMMDKREDWMRHVERSEYSLSQKEMEHLRLIIDDNTMPAHQKLYLSQLMIRCPRLMSADPTMPWSSFEETTKQLNSLLHGDKRSTVLVAENMLSNRVLQPAKDPEEHALNNPDDYFYKALENWCTAQNITFHVIHGDISEDDRIAIFEDMQEARKTGRKCVLYAQSGCLNLGLDLRFIEAIISQQWPHNTPDLYQLLKRINRMNNLNFRFIVTLARDTVEEGILTSAELKYLDVLRCLHGIALSDERMEQLADSNEANSEDENIARKIESSEQKWRRFSRTLQGAGAARTEEFWRLHMDDFVEMISQKDELSIGDSERAIASVVLDMEKNGMLPENGAYTHTCSGGQRLAYTLSKASPEKFRTVRSMDATHEMLDYGGMLLDAHIDQTRNIARTPDALNQLIEAGEIERGSQDLVVLQGLEQTSHSVQQSGDLQFTARVRAILGAVRALKDPVYAGNAEGKIPHDGGKLIIPLDHDVCTPTQLKQLQDQLMAFGMDIMESHTGIVTSKDNESEPPHEMYIITARKVYDPTSEDLNIVDPARLVFTAVHGKEAKAKNKNRKLPFTLPHETFRIGRKQLKASIPTAGREEKLAYLERLSGIVETIQSFASTSDEMIDLLRKKSVQSKLEKIGVICFPHFSTEGKKKQKRKRGDDDTGESSFERRLAFRFLDSPHLFYPYDPQWMQKEKGNPVQED